MDADRNRGTPRIVIGERTDHGGAPHRNRDAPGQVEVLGGYLVVMASGVGGKLEGRVEGGLAVSAFLTAYRSASQREPIPRLLHALRHADDVLASRAQRSRGLAGTGARCAAVLVQHGRLYAVGTGSVGLYVVRGRHAAQLVGSLEPADRGAHPTAGALRVLGAGDDLVAQVTSEPMVLEPGDRVVILGPGFGQLLTEADIAATAGAVPASQAAAKLVERARAAGAVGVLTARVIQYGEGSSSAPLALPPVETVARRGAAAGEAADGASPAAGATRRRTTSEAGDDDSMDAGDDAVSQWFTQTGATPAQPAPGRRGAALPRRGLGSIVQPAPSTGGPARFRRAGVGVVAALTALVAAMVVWRLTSPPPQPATHPSVATGPTEPQLASERGSGDKEAAGGVHDAPVAAIPAGKAKPTTLAEKAGVDADGEANGTRIASAKRTTRQAHHEDAEEGAAPIEALLRAHLPQEPSVLAARVADSLRKEATKDDGAIERARNWARVLRLAAAAAKHKETAPMPAAVRRALDHIFAAEPKAAAEQLNHFIKLQYDRAGDDVFEWIEQWVTQHPGAQPVAVLMRLAASPVGPRTRRWLDERVPQLLASF